MNIHMQACVVEKLPRDLSLTMSGASAVEDSPVHLSHHIRVICLNSTPNPRARVCFNHTTPVFE